MKGGRSLGVRFGSQVASSASCDKVRTSYQENRSTSIKDFESNYPSDFVGILVVEGLPKDVFESSP
jgi:hypothetical protein